MKIGIDIRSIGKQRTGDEVYTLNLIKNLLEIDKENQYFFYTNTKEANVLNKIKKTIDPTKRFKNYWIIPVLPASKALWTFWSLPLHLIKNPVDILHVQYITPFFLPGGIKLVTTIHDVSFAALPRLIDRKDLFFLRRLIPLSLKRADKVIAVSDFTKKEIEKHYKIETTKIERVYNGVSEDYFKIELTAGRTDQIKKKYNIRQPFILYVGTLQPRKNIPFLLKTFDKLKQEGKTEDKIKRLTLVLSGKRYGRNYDKLIEKTLSEMKKSNSKAIKDINFIGFVDDEDLVFLYRMAQAVVLPSFYEGFGLPAIEAMASGSPVIHNNSSCFQEITQGAGLSFENGDRDDFTKKIFDSIINLKLRNNLIDRGRRRALFFNWKKCATETLAIYKKICF